MLKDMRFILAFLFYFVQIVAGVGREGLQLIFEDKFDSTSGLNESIWKYNYPWGSIANHRANMISRQVKKGDDNQLNITAISVRTSSFPTIDTVEYGVVNLDFTSGAVYTGKLVTLQRGLTIVNMRIPSAASTWPMIMLVPLDETLPKITLDAFDDRRNLGYSFAYTSPSGSADSANGVTRSSSDNSLDYHSYAIDVGYDKVTFLVDNVMLRSFVKTNELKQVSNMSLVISLGVGGRSQTTPIVSSDFPATLSVNSVQMWTPKYDGRYKIMNFKSNLFLEVEFGSLTDTARVLQNPFKGSLWQLWDVSYVGYNTYKIINANSRKAMDDFDWQTNDGAKIIQFRFDVKDNQIWKIIENEDDNGTVTLTNVWAQKALSLPNNSVQEGIQLVINEFNQSDDQKWILIPFN